MQYKCDKTDKISVFQWREDRKDSFGRVTPLKGGLKLEHVCLLEIVPSETVPQGVRSQMSLKDKKQPIMQEAAGECSHTEGQQVQKPQSSSTCLGL